MELINFLEQYRTEYLRAFQAVLSNFEGNETYELVVEPIEGEKSETGELSLFRYDVLATPGTKEYYEVNVDVDPVLFNPSLRLTEGGIQVTVKSFTWNACRLLTHGNGLPVAAITDWYNRWIKAELGQAGQDHLEVIHEVSIPEEDILVVDFGSAPIAAVLELFGILAKAGVKKVTVK